MFQTKVVDKVKTHVLCSKPFFENGAVYEIMWQKYCNSRTGHRWQYGQCALHAGYV